MDPAETEPGRCRAIIGGGTRRDATVERCSRPVTSAGGYESIYCGQHRATYLANPSWEDGEPGGGVARYARGRQQVANPKGG